MLARILKLLGLGAKVDAIEEEFDALRSTLRESNERLRADIGLDALPRASLNGRKALKS